MRFFRSVVGVFEQRLEPTAQMLVYERCLARQERVEPLGNVGADALRIRVERARRVNSGGLADCDRPV